MEMLGPAKRGDWGFGLMCYWAFAHCPSSFFSCSRSATITPYASASPRRTLCSECRLLSSGDAGRKKEEGVGVLHAGGRWGQLAHPAAWGAAETNKTLLLTQLFATISV